MSGPPVRPPPPRLGSVVTGQRTVRPFTAGNLPRMTISPRPRLHGQPPYVRPTLSQNRASSNQPPIATAPESGDTVVELCHKIMDEVRHGREEYKRLSDEVKGVRQILGKLEETLKNFQEDSKEQSEVCFSVERSTYKVAKPYNCAVLLKSIYYPGWAC